MPVSGKSEADGTSQAAGEAARRNAELSDRVTGRLSADQIFRQYAASFEEITGLSLRLHSLRHWPPLASGSDCGNPFCVEMLRAGNECVACIRTQRAIAAGAIAEPQSVTCLAGLCETGVPVRLGESLIGFLVVGPVLLAAATEKKFAQTLTAMKRSGIATPRDKLADAYFKSPSLSPERHAPVVQMLIVFAEHLSLLANQVVVQEQHAEPEPILKARRFIRENLAHGLRLGDVAKSAALSTSYFSRMFKKSTSLSFTEYLARVRVEQARELLLNPNLHVSEIAFAVGFQSVPHFNRVFKKLTGAAPGAYRQRAGSPMQSPASMPPENSARIAKDSPRSGKPREGGPRTV